MKKIICLWSIICSLGSVQAQRYDNTWLWGFYPQYQNDSQYPYRGNAHGTFDNDTFISTAKFRAMTFSETNCSISDPADGNLLFYTNGLCVRDTNAQIIENGDSLWYPDWFPENGSFGQRGPWCLLTLPVPEHDSLYKLIDNRYDSLRFASMCYSDLQITEGNLKLLTKDVKFSQVNPEFGGVAACKHGNGRDWWVIFTEANTNCFYKYLLTPDTFMFHSVQCIGRLVDIDDACEDVFSPDGSKLLRTSYYGASDVFDFDRCSGMLSNFLPLDTFHVIDTASGSLADAINSGEFSPNNRFLYLNSGYFVLQYDLLAANVNASKDTVGQIDYFIDTVAQNSNYYVFYLAQTAPDGKIYVGPAFGQRFFSTIDNPNGKGDSCQFKLRSVVVPKWIDLTIPYSPNYRLGPLIGSACDTVYSDIKPIYAQTPWLKVYPNPATDMVRVDYNWVEWEKIANCELQIMNGLGQVVMQQTVPRYSTRQDVSVKELASGVYTVSLQSSSTFGGHVAVLAVCKLVKE